MQRIYPLDAMNTGYSTPIWARRPSIASEMSEEWVEIAPAQRRPTGEAAYQRWLGFHRLGHAQLADDLRLEIGLMVGGGYIVRYSIRASRAAELGLTPEAAMAGVGDRRVRLGHDHLLLSPSWIAGVGATQPRPPRR